MKIAVMGSGWLGLPLAKSLQDSGHNIVATRRSIEGVNELVQDNLDGIQFELSENLEQPKLDKIFSSDLLFLNIPVGRKSAVNNEFLTCIESVLKRASRGSVKHVIFISTTSVYGDQSCTIIEQSPTAPNTHSGKVNLAIEQLVTKYFTGNGSVIRLAGLVGSGRHPAKFLAGKTDLNNPTQVVNLVHQQDVISAIHKVIDNQLWGETFLLSATSHPTRKEYYSWAAKKLNLAAPQFEEPKEGELSSGKTIDASTSLTRLGLKLKYVSPYDML